MSRHALGYHYAARAGQSLQHAHGIKHKYISREYAQQRRYHKEQHRANQYALAPVLVGERPYEQLTGGKTYHAGREAHGGQRGRGVEIACHLRQHRKVEVCNERTEGRKHAERGRNKYFHVLFHCYPLLSYSGAKLAKMYEPRKESRQAADHAYTKPQGFIDQKHRRIYEKYGRRKMIGKYE